MAYRQDWVRLIRALAPKYGVDPRAALAVASSEGLSGAVGDSGHAFGPFQLNDAGGVITNRPGNHRAFAESPQGIEWALAQIGQVARGLHGQQAVSNIVRRFERPADPGGEIVRALGSYGKVGGASAAPMPTATPQVGASAGQGTSDIRTLLARQLAGGGDVNFLAFARQVQGARQQPRMVKATHQTGPNVPATPGAANLVSIAARQLGQPYVWGGESRKEGGFDCSGLVDWSMRQQGYQGPRLTTYNIAKLGQSVKGHPLQPGDLVLANGGEHVVIYAGHGRVIAAPHRGTRVQFQPLSKFHITDVRRV